MSIRHWPKEERPREKLLQRGAKHLSDAELLALFARSGTRGNTAIDMGRHWLTQAGSLKALLELAPDDYKEFPGLGTATYCQLQAALELCKRYLQAPLTETLTILDTKQAHDYCTMQLRPHKREVFACLSFNPQNQLLDYTELFYGTLSTAQIYPREIIAHALRTQASSVIFAHNHPGGNAQASPADLQLTRVLTQALKLIDVTVLDHIIVGTEQTLSLLSA